MEKIKINKKLQQEIDNFKEIKELEEGIQNM
jgi:hypothetical protein